MSEFDLIYIETATKKIWHVQRVTPQDYRLRDPITGETERVSRYEIKTRFEFQSKISMEKVRTRSKPILQIKLA
jgi:hypothetical protein